MVPEEWVPHEPTEKQKLFLSLTEQEALLGGAAGGGKSDCLLMGALQYVDVPEYAGLIIRRTYSDLVLPGAIMERAREWLANTPAKWNENEKTFKFPSGATLTFGYLETRNDKYRYQSTELNYIAFDETSQFSEEDYLYLFSRLRRKKDSIIPGRMRAASNPGGVGHEWVKRRFVDPGAPSRPFIPSKLNDNPYIDRKSYEESLNNLDAVTKAQLLHGNWDVLPSGGMFARERTEIVAASHWDIVHRVRAWDKAGTAGAGDYTVGVLMAATPDRRYFVEDVKRGQWSEREREKTIRETAEADRAEYGDVDIWIEQEPGSGGKDSAQYTLRNLAGFSARAERVSGDKTTRAKPFAAQWEAENVYLVRGDWNEQYLTELVAFPEGPQDDVVDASSMAFNKLTKAKKRSKQVQTIKRGYI